MSCLTLQTALFAETESVSQAQGLVPIKPKTSSRVSHCATGGESVVQREQEIPFLGREELIRLMKEGKTVFFDTREAKEFAASHIPNAVNTPFSKRTEYFKKNLEQYKGATVIPYCNWDFRAYIGALELKKMGYTNVQMMYPHGLRSWEADGFPVAGESVGASDKEAREKLHKMLEMPLLHSSLRAERSNLRTEIASSPTAPRTDMRDRHITLHIYKKRVEPGQIEASVGDRLILNLIAEEEDHWFVAPDFGVNVHLGPNERRTIHLDMIRSGYFPYGCISCCTRYQCRVKQSILVDFNVETCQAPTEVIPINRLTDITNNLISPSR